MNSVEVGVIVLEVGGLGIGGLQCRGGVNKFLLPPLDCGPGIRSGIDG